MIILITLAAVVVFSIAFHKVYRKGYNDGIKAGKKRK